MKRATYEDVLNAPENKVAEILDGELFLSPRPALRHSAASSELGAAIGSAFNRRAGDPGGPGGWRILDEPELHLDEHVVVPDLAGWRRERLPVRSRRRRSRLSLRTGCARSSPRPRSGSTAAGSSGSTPRRAWRTRGSSSRPHRTLEVLRLRDGAWTIVGVWEDAAIVRAEPFEAVALELGRLWAD